jgi:RimJ/RimL family protein N-acetyltransferase
MINWATEYEVENFAKYEFRLMNKYDFMQYVDAHNESIESNKDYMDLGYFSIERPLKIHQAHYNENVRDQTMDMFGIFDDGKLLGMACYFNTLWSENGCHVTIWIRKSAKGKGIGTYFLKRISSQAVYNKKFRFVELLIDDENMPSRRMAEKVGYELMEIMEVPTQGLKGSGKYCRYILFSPELDAVAENWHMQPIDLIDHPAFYKEYRSLIKSKEINDFYKWPLEVLSVRKYEGEPFGPVLEQLTLEALQEEEFLQNLHNKAPQMKNRITLSRSANWGRSLYR